MPFDFEAAQMHRDTLVQYYRRLMHTQTPDGTWDWVLKKEIAEIDAERAAAHAINAKKITGQGDPSQSNLERKLCSHFIASGSF